MILPHNIEIENELLASIIMMPENIKKVGELLPEDFYNTMNQKIFAAMVSLNNQKIDIALTLIGDILKKNEPKNEAILKHLLLISDSSKMALNTYSHSKKVKSYSALRKLSILCMQVQDKCNSGDVPDDIISFAQKEVLEIEQTAKKDKFFTTEDLMLKAVERIEKAQVEKKKIGIDLGLADIRKYMFVHGSKLIILSARPGLGKTALMLAMAKHIALQGIKVSVISIEMDNNELADRMLSADSNFNSLTFYNPGTLNNKDINAIGDSSSFLSSLPILFDDAKKDINDIKRVSRKMKQDGCKIIFIDQLSKIRYPNNLTEFSGYTKNVNEIAELKKELRMPIVLLAQLGRKVEESHDKKPQIWHLKQTGAIEEDADMILFIYRPGVYGLCDSMGQKYPMSYTQILMPKNRGGITGEDTSARFNDKRGFFELDPNIQY